MATNSVSGNGNTFDSCSHTLKFFDSEAGEEVCGGCGVVLNQRIEVTQIQEHPETTTRLSTMRLYDNGLFTHTGSTDDLSVNTYTKNMDSLNRSSMLYNNKMKNLNKAMKMLESISIPLQLSPQVMDRAAYIYRKALKAKLILGRSIPGIMGACIYIACREADKPALMEAIQALIKEERADVFESYKLLSRNLNIHLPVQQGNIYLSKFAQLCNLSEKSVRLAVEILDKVEMHEKSQGKAGRTLAAGALFLAALENGERITQDMMSEASGVSTVTLRKRCRELAPIVNIDITNLRERIVELRQIHG